MSEGGKGRTVELRYDGGEQTFPLLTGSEGDQAIDVKNLLSGASMTTLDPGFGNTASCRSEITYIDGAAGILRYRGYPIQELAKQDRKSTRLNSSHVKISYAVFCLKKKKITQSNATH